MAKKHEVVFFQGGGLIKGKKFKQKKIKTLFNINSCQIKGIFGKILERLYLSPNNLKVLYFSLKTLPFLLKGKFNVLIPTNGFWQVLICKAARLLKGSKIIIFGRAGIGFHDKDNLKLNPDIFIALTKYAKAWAEQISPKTKIIYIPNMIDCRIYSPNKKLLLKKKTPIILTVAALTKYKRIDLVIKAVAKMKTKCFLLIVGQGELKKDLNLLGEKLLGDNFSIKQFSNKLMPQVYNSCKVFTLASDFQDAFPRVMLEALACGRNIVVSDADIKKEVIGKAGLFVNPMDINSYAMVLDKALILKNSKLARKQALKFDISKIGPKYEKVFLKTLKNI